MPLVGTKAVTAFGRKQTSIFDTHSSRHDAIIAKIAGPQKCQQVPSNMIKASKLLNPTISFFFKKIIQIKFLFPLSYTNMHCNHDNPPNITPPGVIFGRWRGGYIFSFRCLRRPYIFPCFPIKNKGVNYHAAYSFFVSQTTTTYHTEKLHHCAHQWPVSPVSPQVPLPRCLAV